MSRAFVKEDDQEEPPFIPPRASLPTGLTNYITQQGLKALKAEKEQLGIDKENAYQLDNDYNKRREIAIIKGKLKLLEERINSARVLIPEERFKDEVRFGAHVLLKLNGLKQQFQLVGVDEADIKNGKIAFHSPISKAIIGSGIGDSIVFNLGIEKRTIEVLSIQY